MTPRIFEDSRDLLLQEQLDAETVQRLLAPVGFSDWQAAYRRLKRIPVNSEAGLSLAASLSHLLMILADMANPDHLLVNFERFAQNTPNQLELFHDFASNPRTLEILFTLFTGSQFLTEILLRQPEYFERLTAHHRLAQPKSPEQFHHEAQAALAPLLTGRDSNPLVDLSTQVEPALDALRRFQRWELLRIGTADLLGSFDLPTVTVQLSYLADSLVQACLTIAAGQSNSTVDNFLVVALGKLGGEELNYSSDIDLLFLVDSNPTAYRQLGQRLIDALTRITAEGFLYRVDMRLRPWGRDGALVSSVEGYLSYLQKHARLWEKQALLKARLIAGNKLLGREFIGQAQPLIFSFDARGEIVRADVHALKQRIEAQLRQRGREWGEVKLGQGSIRDIEFVTQYLQLKHGGRYPEVRSHNTLEALTRLWTCKFLAPDEYRVLTDGYIFLRTIEHHLQLMHYRQTHTLPNETEALTHLARRLGFQGMEAGSKFTARYQQHSAVIRAVYQRYLGDTEEPESSESQLPAPDLLPLLARMHPSYVVTFSEADIKRHAILAEQLDQDHLVKMEATPLDDDYWRITIVGYDYLGELSLICGLLFVYGFNIIDGHVFSFGPPAIPQQPAVESPGLRRRPYRSAQPAGQDSLRKIVDVFTVRSVLGQASDEIWSCYAADLAGLLRRLQAGEQRAAQGELAKRIAVTLREMPGTPTKLYPIDIDIDNEASDRHTVLRIDALDTIGFLYEFTNALALHGINVRRMRVESIGNRVRDTLYVTDARRQKITDLNKQRQLRVATVLIKHFTHLLPHSPNPELALLHFREFVAQLFTRPNWPNELASLTQPEVLDTLARLLGVSDFLWNDFLRMQHANLFPIIRDTDLLATAKSKEELRAELESILRTTPRGAAQRDALNAFKDREMFRVDMRQIQDYITELGQFSGELTNLAEAVVEAAYHLCAQELRAHFGLPRLANGRLCPLSICALGKFGGRELGFASDIELMFIFAGNGKTSGPRVITTAEFFEKLVQEISQTIRARQKGIFEIDLRLRPYGKAGSLAVSLDSFRRYFGPKGDAWPYERQALVKLRPIVGDEKLGQQIVALRDQFIYSGEPFDVAAMRAMRERQVRHLVTAGTLNAKHSPGGLVDVEYLVQGLQINHAQANPKLRLTNTREAMAALAAANILQPDDYARLGEAHIFLRRLINALRMVQGHAKDLTVPPTDSEEFAFLARRLNYGQELDRLRDDLTRHMICVQELSMRLLG